MNYEAYWISPYGDVIPVDQRHINLIVDYPEKFGLSKEKVADLYLQYKEPVGFEGKARKEIIKDLFRAGWIRIRYMSRSDSWTIQLFGLEDRKKDYIRDWAEKVTDGTYDKASKHSDVAILTLDRAMEDNDRVVYSMNDILDYKLYEGVRKGSHTTRFCLIENYGGVRDIRVALLVNNKAGEQVDTRRSY